jgi:SAM-dependent methyltransferase
MDPTQRFSDRVDDYVRSRPHYPRKLVPLLQREIGLTSSWLIADVGSGTGISSEPFIANGNRVIGIEPNAAMREAAESLFASQANFESVDGTAEDTTLPARSIDAILAGQAFHWFDRDAARAEFRRIGKPDAWTVLVWNRRETESTPFQMDYETVVEQYGTDYQQVRHDRMGTGIFEEFFAGDFQLRTLPNAQQLDYAGLSARLLSSSYTPAAGDPRRAPMLHELHRVFDRHQENGTVRFDYVTEIVFGRLGMTA